MDLKLQLLALLFATLACVKYTMAEDEAEEEKIEIEILKEAPADCERKSKKFDQLSMHYTGTLTETGAKFDSSHDRGQPFPFQIGTGQVIRGWDEGLLDMCVGEKRLLKIPASKGYGEQGAGDSIPPNAHLTFETELLSIEDGQAPPNVFKMIDTDEDNMLSQKEVVDYMKKQAIDAGDPSGEENDHADMISQIFSHEDKDKDGFISHEEFSGPKHDEL